jgi:hypothetical protein
LSLNWAADENPDPMPAELEMEIPREFRRF